MEKLKSMYLFSNTNARSIIDYLERRGEVPMDELAHHYSSTNIEGELKELSNRSFVKLTTENDKIKSVRITSQGKLVVNKSVEMGSNIENLINLLKIRVKWNY
jgi:hypothetical protein